ncbi:MAG TPA: hypothetical protein PLX97_02835 [Gemmatales bacterium]|nr:hypothetical protein [Gemmatales bacterium]
MYQRDVSAELKEEIGRLAVALDRLAEVHAKDRGVKDEAARETLEWLKRNGAKDIKEVPASDDRADELKTSYVRRGVSPAGGLGDSGGIDFTTINRLNSAFRALQGDVGGFQRTLAAASHWGSKAMGLAEKLQESTSSDSTKPLNLKQAKINTINKLLDEKGLSAGIAEYFNTAGPRVSDIEESRKYMGYDEALKEAQKKSDERLLSKAKQAAKPAPPKDNGLLVPPPPGTISGGLDVAALAKIATTTALIAAPIVAGKMIQASAMSQIEGARPFQMLDAGLATSFAMYDQKNLVTKMRQARGISSSMDQLLGSEARFQETLEPIKTAASNAWSSFTSGGVDLLNTLLKPISWLAKGDRKSNRDRALDQQAWNGASIGAWIGGAIGGLGGLFFGGVGAIPGAMWGAAAGGGIGFATGGFEEMITERRKKELDKIIGDGQKHKGMIDIFAMELENKGVCPPRKFVP